MANSAKALVIRDTLAQDIYARTGLTVVKGLDASNFPQLLVGTLTSTSQGAYVRIKQLDSLNTDVLGLTQNVFTPHVIQVALEMSTITNVSYLTVHNFSLLLGELMKMGTRVELYVRAQGTAPSVSDITAANLAATWETSLQYPMMASI